jgi:hypothetical protein
MTTTADPLASSDYQVTLTMRRVSAVQWNGTCQCTHGQVSSGTFLDQSSGLNPLAVVQGLRDNHNRSIHCYCPYAPPTQQASVTFGVASTIINGQLRLIPQTSAVTPAGNFYFGPPTTCQRLGAYQLDLTLTLNKNQQAVHGYAHIMLDRTIIASTSTQAPVIGQLPVDPTAPTTTVSVRTMTNIQAGQFVLAAYENIDGPPVDVTLATFTLGAVWVP